MIQRIIFAILKAGLAEIKADPRILDDIFGDEGYGLSTTEIDAIKTLFKDNTPTVVHGYARTEQSFPLYAIVLGSEGEDTKLVGDDAGMIGDIDDPDFGADVLSTIWRHTYQILCYTEHPDVTTYIYEVAKSILLTGIPDFSEEGIFEIEISGNDLMPDPRYLPSHLFARQITFNCQREFLRVERATRLGKAFKVRGIHVDKRGSSSDIGGVSTLVTVIPEGSKEA